MEKLNQPQFFPTRQPPFYSEIIIFQVDVEKMAKGKTEEIKSVNNNNENKKEKSKNEKKKGEKAPPAEEKKEICEGEKK